MKTPTALQLTNLRTAAVCEKANGRGTVYGYEYGILETRGWMTSKIIGKSGVKGGGTKARVYTLTDAGWALLAQHGQMP